MMRLSFFFALASLAALTTPQAHADPKPSLWSQLVDPHKEATKAALSAAQSALNKGALLKAEALILGVLRNHPRHPHALLLQASLLRRKGVYQEAKTHLDTLLPQLKDPRLQAAAHRESALVAIHLKDYQSARTHHALTLPNTRNSGATLDHTLRSGALLMVLGDLSGAEKEFQRALRAAPRNKDALLGLAASLERQGQRDAARAHLRRAVLHHPSGDLPEPGDTLLFQSAERLYYKALLQNALGQSRAAIQNLQEMTRLAQKHEHPYHEEALNTLQAYRKEGPALLYEGPFPLWNPGPARFSDKGLLVIGDRRGRLLHIDLTHDKIAQGPILSGPSIVGVHLEPGGQTTLYYPHGERGVLSKRGKFSPKPAVRRMLGHQIRALSPDGRAVLVSNTRRTQWSLSKIDGSREHKIWLHHKPDHVALGPWNEALGTAPVATWTNRASLKLFTEPEQKSPPHYKPPRRHPPMVFHAIAFSPDGGQIIMAGQKHLLSLRTSDLKVTSMMEFQGEEKTGQAREIVFDPKGHAGRGPAVLILYQNRYRALRWDAILPKPIKTR